MKISVIIPVYNCEKYLRDCLESVIKQSYKELEIILIDDGSTDSSGSICDYYAEMDSRVQVIHQKNKGVSASRNAGMLRMSGELVSFIDADDTLDLDMYEFLYSLMETYDADIVHCGYRHVVGDEIRLVHDSHQIIEQNKEEALKCLIGAKLFVGSLWNKLYKTDFYGAPLRSFAPCGGKALRARIARTFGATYSNLLLTHNKNSTDKSLCCFCGAP